MEPFPFSEEEWSLVSDAAREATNAALMDDEILRASRVEDLIEALHSLREKYGSHPVLLETEADFTDDPSDSIALYKQAKRLAIEHALPTYTIRISLAQALVDHFGYADQARQELLACRDEVTEHREKHEQDQWSQLWRECGGAAGQPEMR